MTATAVPIEVARTVAPTIDPAFDVERVRRDFPILRQTVRGKPLVYLDNAATSQKPQCVIDAETRYYTHDNSNVHRGVHLLSERATREYEGSRAKVRKHLNAAHDHEIIFTRGTTEAINLVAFSFGARLREGDEVVISEMEHHSNIVPWQLACRRSGAVLRFVPISDAGEFLFDEYRKLLSPRTRLVAVTHVSNALGTVVPVREVIREAHQRGIPVLLDGAQAAPHMPVDVRSLGCDFYALSGHKIFGPTGIGVLYGRTELLDAMPPWQGGGDMIRTVSLRESTWNDLPYKFEAGTPNIAGAIGLGAAIDWLSHLDFEAAGGWEHELLTYATDALEDIEGVRILGTAPHKEAVISFLIDGVHAHDVGTILDREGVAVRAGHHCAQPVMERFGVASTARASLAFYNTKSEVDALIRGIHKVREVFA